MSELKVSTIESNNTLTANSLTVGNVTINATGITAPTYVINTSAVAIGNSSANVIITANSSVNFVVVNNAPNVFPNPLDIYAWASQASGFNNCTVSRDTSIELSPAGGIPFKIKPTGSDPYPSTYSSNTWNLATTANNDIWKVSGYVRANGDITLAANEFLLLLPANSSGNYGTAGTPNSTPSATLIGNTWTYFEKIFQINGNANTKYIQIRPDGPNSGLNDLWYDGLSLQRVFSNTIPTETVNTQLFTANGTWTKPSWATDGKELVIVHMWGGGGGGSTNATAGYAGAGGAFVYGYFIASNCNATCNVVVGLGGSATVNGTPGGISLFYANTTNALTAYGGEGGNQTVQGGGNGGGWFANTGPLVGTRGTTGTDSTFGGGGGSVGSPYNSGNSVYGGGGGSASGQGRAGSSIYGGGGGGGTTGGTSVYGGAGGKSAAGSIPGGGGDASQIGARGEVRVYTYRIVS